MPDEAITDPAEIASYVASARELYLVPSLDLPIEISNPPVVVRTASGARFMAWLPVEDDDLVP